MHGPFLSWSLPPLGFSGSPVPVLLKCLSWQSTFPGETAVGPARVSGLFPVCQLRVLRADWVRGVPGLLATRSFCHCPGSAVTMTTEANVPSASQARNLPTSSLARAAPWEMSADTSGSPTQQTLELYQPPGIDLYQHFMKS